MAEDKPEPGKPFAWGLRPGGSAEQPSLDDAAPEPGEVLDQGHFRAISQPAIGGGPAAADEPQIPAPYEDVPTAEFDFRAPPPPPADPIRPPDYQSHLPLPWEQQLPAVDSSLHGATEAMAAQSVAMHTPEAESPPTSALDALFNDKHFQEYEESPVAALAPRALERPPVAAAPVRPTAPLPGNQRVLIWVAGALVAALALAGLFFIGTRLPSPAPAGEAKPTPSATAEPSLAPPAAPPVAAIGPVAPGTHEWNELLGTECLEPFPSAWEEEYTVVDCAAPHEGQLVYRGRFEDSALDPFPGVEALQARMNLLCSAPTNIDYPAASAYSDIQVSASYAGTADDWADGNRHFFCFVSRSSGEPFTTGVATPAQPPVVIPVAPAPEP